VTRVAVIGTGAMGRNHVRVYGEMPDAELVAVADLDSGAVHQVAQTYGARAYTDYKKMLQREEVEAVTVAVPTAAHHRVVLDALAAGCHVLVEKPVAATVEEARDMVAAAERADRVLMVGHIERYNPAVIELKRRLDGGELGRVFHVHARRLGPFPERVQDVGVVVDAATHDLDIIRFLLGSEAIRVHAETKSALRTRREDLLNGMLRFEDDTVALLEINWLTPTKIRELHVTGQRGMFRADYLTQDLYFYENADANPIAWNALQLLRGVSEGMMTRFALQKREPLRVEQEAFLAAVGGDKGAVVTAQDGLAALKLALALIKSGQQGRSIQLRPSKRSAASAT
jgi:UDP-N-acetylglucosamine 3-dehydrogenase